MVDTTPPAGNPQDDQPTVVNNVPEAESAAEAEAAESPVASTAPVAGHRSKRRFVLAGSIVAAVIVLGGTFGAGVLVGHFSTPRGHDMSAGFRPFHGEGDRHFGRDADPGRRPAPDAPGTPPSGTHAEKGPGGGGDSAP